MNAKNSRDIAGDREIVISRVLNAPRELVWKVYTDTKHISQWWGPTGFTTTTHSVDQKPGGTWRFTMHGPDGRDYENRVNYLEIQKPERLVYKHGGEGETESINFLVTVTFEDQDGKTKFTMTSVFPSAEERDYVVKTFGAIEGGIQTVDRMAEHLAKETGTRTTSLTLALPSDREIVLSRAFNAPRRLVFEALSKPEHMKKWWGCRDASLSVCEMDFRPGGAWRTVLRMPDGSEHPFKGEYKEIVPPEKIAYTFIYDVDFIRDHPALETITLEERDGQTIYKATVLHGSKEARDGHLSSGMEPGASESLSRLEELLEQMA